LFYNRLRFFKGVVQMLKRWLTLTLTVLVVALLLASYPAVPAEADHTTNRIHSCRTIDQSGSYVLDRNLEATGDCLVVPTSHVTIDLAGYTISGNGAGRGVTFADVDPATPGVQLPEDITVRNGSITNFSDGVFLSGKHHVVEKVRATHNGLRGIITSGGGSTVRDSVASENGIHGIQMSSGAGNSVIGNVANSNGGNGINLFSGCPSTVLNNVATGNPAADIVANPLTCTRANNSPIP
jgi:parallel beta-helix repeat protein